MMATDGGFVALIEKSGGARAFAKAVANSVNSKVKAQLAAWLGGLVIFFSDSGNSLILGPMFRPIFDRLKASRAKLSLYFGLHLLASLYSDSHHRLGRLYHEHYCDRV